MKKSIDITGFSALMCCHVYVARLISAMGVCIYVIVDEHHAPVKTARQGNVRSVMFT